MSDLKRELLKEMTCELINFLCQRRRINESLCKFAVKFASDWIDKISNEEVEEVFKILKKYACIIR